MRWSINSAIVGMVAAHSDIDARAETLEAESRRQRAKMQTGRGTLAHAISDQICVAKAKVCQLVPTMGTGLQKSVFERAVAGTFCEKYGVDFLSRGRTGTLGDAFCSAVTLGLKVGVLALGVAVFAPLLGAARGLIVWQRERNLRETPVPAQGDACAPGARQARHGEGRGPTASSEVNAAVRQRHQERKASSFYGRAA